MKNRTLVCSVFLLIQFVFATGIALAADSEAQSGRLSLDGQWRFALAPDEDSADAKYGKFHKADFDAATLATFKPITVPSNWTTNEEFESAHYVNGTKSEGFYLHTFDAPASMKDQRVLLHFDGVWVSAEVWLNGARVGRHDSGFTAFAFDVSKIIKPGEKNSLAVRVRQQVQTFKFDSNDDWGLPGIYRSVWLETTPRELFINSVDVRAKFDSEYRNADVAIRTFISRDEKADFFAPSPPFDVTATLTRDGKTIATQTYAAATITGAHNGRDIPITLRVTQPAAWTAETPNLHDLRIDLHYKGRLVHSWSDRIGIREVDTSGGVLRVNGRPVKLRGVGRHDEHPDVGRATRPEHWKQDLELMKAANINAIRTVHYPPAEGFVRLCDEMGFYLLEEIPLGFGGDRMLDPMMAEGMYLRIHETVARDRNRPSVIIWDLGNEDPFTANHLAGLRALKGLDPTRPTLLPFRAEEYLPPEVDILAPHYWSSTQYDALASRATRPLVTTEYTHALGPSDFGELQQRFDAITAHPAGAGGMIWTWADQGLRRPVNGRKILDPMNDKKSYTREGSELVGDKIIEDGKYVLDSHGNNGTDGIVDADRTPQRDYWETKGSYAPVRLLAERVLFAPGQSSVLIPVRNDFDFLNLNTCKFVWELHRDADVIARGETKLDAEPHNTVRLEIPTTAVTEISDHVYYADITILRADGSEMTRKSVRIGNESTPQPPAPSAKQPAAPRIEKEEEIIPATVPPSKPTGHEFLRVRVGAVCYRFDASTGQIRLITIGNKSVISGAATPVIWRPATHDERNRLDRRERQHDWDTFMLNLPPKLLSWDAQNTPEGARLTARVEYRKDDLNAFLATITYTITTDGILRIALEVEPRLDVPFIPEIGMEFDVGRHVKTFTWLGHGPLDSLANKIAATRFGWWSSAPADPLAHGNKSTLDWARLTYENGAAMHIRNAQAVRLGGDAKRGYTFRVLTNQAGAWTKNGPAEQPEWQLDLEKQKTFRGSFELVPMAK